MMRIKSLEFFPVRLPFRFAFKHSLASRNCSENVIARAVVETESKQEIVGWGEGIPRDYVTGETSETALARLRSEYAPRFINQRFSEADEVVRFLKDEFYELGLQALPYGASFCALELALLDAVARASGLRLSTWLAGKKQVDLSCPVTYGGVLPLVSCRYLSLVLPLYRLWGFSTVKLKVGSDLEDAVERVKLARKMLGKAMTLRVDANAAWTVDQAFRFAERVRPFRVASIEQPVPADDLKALAELSNCLPEQIVADESLCTIEQALTLAHEKICTGFNIRLSKVGGWLAATEMVEIAKRAGIGCHLGAQVGESGILSAAGRAFAMAEGPFENLEGSANSFLLRQDLTSENLTFGFRGIGKPILNTGLAVEVVPEQLKALRLVEDKAEVKEAPLPDVLMRC